MGKVIDVHVHVGSSAALYVGGSIQIVTSRMSRHGITHSVVSPIPGFEDPEGIKSVKEMNAQVADIQKNNADVFPLVFGVAAARRKGGRRGDDSCVRRTWHGRTDVPP